MRALLAAGAVSAALAGAFVALKREPPRTDLPILRRVSWPEGRLYLYAFALRSGGEQREGEIALQRAGNLVAISYVGQTAFLNVDMRGEVRAISFAPELNAGARDALRSIALHLNYTLPLRSEAQWEAEEMTSLGLLRSRYRHDGAVLKREAIAWTQLTGAQKLSGGASIALDQIDVPVAIEEAVQSSYTPPGETRPLEQGWTFMLHRKSETAGAPSLETALAAARPQPLYEPADPRLLITLSEVLRTIDSQQPPARDFVQRAAMLLRQQPESIPEVARHFDGAGSLPLDVLAETGSPAAQQSMRSLLSTRELRQQFAPHLALLADPDVGSVRFVESAFHEQPSPALAAAMGSLIRRLMDQARGELAAELVDGLRRELKSCRSQELRLALTAAIPSALSEGGQR